MAGKPGYKETAVGWIPNDWNSELLGRFVTLLTGAPFKSELFSSDEGVPLIRIRDLLRGFSETGYLGEYDGRYIVNTGDVLVGMDGEFHVVRWKGSCALLNQRVLKISEKQGLSDEGFLFFLVANAIGKIQHGISATTVKHLSTKDLQNLLAAIPPLPEQQKIAAILTAVDDKLDIIAHQIEATQTLKRGLMQTLFSRGVGTQDANGRWVPHAEVKDSLLGKIPARWEIAKVGDVCEVKGGKRLPKGESLIEENTGFPYIRVTDMYMGGVNTEGILYVPTHIQPSIARYTISKDDIFITVAGTLGLIGLVPDELDGANLTENADKLTDIRINRDYLFYCLCSDAIQETIAREATANAQPKLALTRIREFSFPLPPNDEQAHIASILKESDRKLKSLSAKQKCWQSLKRGLMQKLLTGEWRVKLDTETVAA